LPAVTLTFDNGPERAATPRVLEALADRGVRATFFVLGRKLAHPQGRALAERAREEGHWIGNHTFTHPAPFGELADPLQARREIEEAQAVIGDLAHPDRLFRPVGGGGELGRHLLTPEAVDTLVAGRYTCVLWTAVAGDWDDPDGWVERALERCAEDAVLVLHDLPTGAMDHLGSFLDRAIEAGTRFRQAFPARSVPISRGEVVGDLGAFVSGS
jgi:peptidoglycan-N-acetylglucosamine deacetylase